VANTLLVQDDGVVWVGTRRGLSRVNAARDLRFASEDALANEDLTALFEDRDRNLWIGTRSGRLYRRQGSGGKIDLAESEGTAARGGVFALTEDRNGALWVGTGRGLERYRDGSFVTATSAEGLPNEQIMSIATRRAGGLWVLDGRGVLSIYENGSGRLADPGTTIAGDGMLGMVETEDGSLWVGGATHQRYRGGRWDHYPNPHGEIEVIVPDGSGLLLAETEGDGTSTIWHFEEGSFSPMPLAVPLAHVQRLFRDRSGRLWISSGGSGLVREGPSGAIHVFRASDGLPNDIVYGIDQDAAGDVWVATRGGLARIRGDVVASLAGAPEVPRHSPVHLQEDGLGYLWATADDGIYRLALEDLDARADGRGAPALSRKFTTRDGLLTVQVSWRCSAQARGSDGRLFYATAYGLASIDPASLERTPAEPGVAIDEVWAGGRRTSPWSRSVPAP
jgi:ligand-binding sensor domain-containing protein